jgi:hypothetical protein
MLVGPPPPFVQCLPCPQGAYCDGGLAPPVALEGWYNLDGVGPEECPPERLARPFCDYVVPCEPKEACVGNNTCGRGCVCVRGGGKGPSVGAVW